MELNDLKIKMKAYRKLYAMEQIEFAKLCCLPKIQIQNYESGITNPKHDALIKICKNIELNDEDTKKLLIQVMSKSERIELLLPDYFSGKIQINEIAVKIECHSTLVIDVINNSDQNINNIQIKKPEFESTEKIEYPGSGKSIMHFEGKTIGEWHSMSETEKNKYN